MIDGYTNIENTIFHDNRLTWKAKGLYCQLCSLPESWDFNLKGLQTLSSGGRKNLLSAVQELKQYGYLDIIQVRKKDGRISYKYIIKNNIPP